MMTYSSNDSGNWPSEVESEAIAWVRLITSGDATAADAEALRIWRQKSPAHRAAFDDASRLWKDLAPASRSWQQNNATVISAERLRRSRVALTRRLLLGGGLAAASTAAAYAAVHPPMGLWPSLSALQADYRTGTGEQRNVALAGDITVRMNTQTSITLQPSSDGVERVQLIGGEASFAAGSGGGRLAVRAADRWITAQVAKFDVRHVDGSNPEAVTVTCLEGELSIEQENTMLLPRQQLRYQRGSRATIEAVDPDIVSAWQRGLLIFRSTSIAAAVEEVNRYRSGLILVMNPELARQQISGQFRIDRLNDFTAQLERAFGTKVVSLPAGLILLS